MVEVKIELFPPSSQSRKKVEPLKVGLFTLVKMREHADWYIFERYGWEKERGV